MGSKKPKGDRWPMTMLDGKRRPAWSNALGRTEDVELAEELAYFLEGRRLHQLERSRRGVEAVKRKARERKLVHERSKRDSIWAENYRKNRGYDPIGFRSLILGGNVKIKQRDAGGLGKGGVDELVPRSWQRGLMDEFVEHRRMGQTRWLEIIIKSRQLGFCLDPSTRVLTAALEWKSLAEVNVGDELIATDEHPSKHERGGCRYMRAATVQRVFRKRCEAFRVTFADGRTVVCSDLHKWLSRTPRITTAGWRTLRGDPLDRAVIGQGGNRQRTNKLLKGYSVRAVTTPWGAPDYEDGWFGGMLDGEGSINLKKPGRPASINVSQREGPVWERVLQYLARGGYGHRIEADKNPTRKSKFGKSAVPKAVVGRLEHMIRLVGKTRPTRFVANRFWEGRKLGHGGWVKVVSIEALGERDMMDIQTSTGTYIAEGFVSHNSTFWDAVIFTDAECNPGIECAIAAHRDKTLLALNQNFRTFVGRDDAKKAGRLKRLADKMIETPKGSLIHFDTATDSFGRGGSLTHIHVSEADYIQDLNGAMESVLASMMKTPWSSAVFESTLRRNSGSDFKAFIEQRMDEQERLKATGGSGIEWLDTNFRVRFIPWVKDETARLTLKDDEREKLAAFVESSHNPHREYEQELIGKHGLSLEQVAWWHKMCNEDCNGDLIKMREAYPTTWDEALSMVRGASFFDSAALAWMKTTCRSPIKRYRATYDGITETRAEGDALDVWDDEIPGHSYVIGVDCRNSAAAGKGSAFNYAVVLDITTGVQVAEYMGLMGASEFAIGVWRAAQKYNDALVVAETAGDGGAFDDQLRNVHGYWNVYVREPFGNTQYTDGKRYGFHASGQAVSVLSGRLQDNVNECRVEIRSFRLLDHLISLNRHGGLNLKQTDKERSRDEADDGARALALTFFGHEMGKRRWDDKRLLPPMENATPTVRGGNAPPNNMILELFDEQHSQDKAIWATMLDGV
jgi:hypothetical protein